jgi:dipeptidyl aminopeptidase/acylaminoacyl peptidase
MFEYFPNNDDWSAKVALSIAMGGEIAEIDAACRPLKSLSDSASSPTASEAWYQSWSRLGHHLEHLAQEDLTRECELSAGAKTLRAANYFLFAEQSLPLRDPRRLCTYRRMLDTFARGVRLRGDDAERVDVAYEGAVLSGWLRIPAGAGTHPCVIVYNGFDSSKETSYLAYAEIATRRGVAVLFVDQEGTGEAMRLHGLVRRYDTEVSAGLFVDFLQRHGRIDRDRIGIVGLSAGGYCAPRAAAFEKRLKCAASIGALFNLDSHREFFLSLAPPPVVERLLAVTGGKSLQDAVEIFSRRDLSKAIDRVECPLLVIHGENDRQVPLWHAERTVAAAVNASRADLKVFTLSEGSSEHCGLDIMSMQGEYCFDWVAWTLGSSSSSMPSRSL